MKKKLVILGSTGSIGTNALWVARNLEDEVEVVGLAAGTRYEDLAQQAREFGVDHVAIGDPAYLTQLRQSLPVSCQAGAGARALEELATLAKADIVLCAITGVDGLKPVIEAIKAGKDIALASKEILVSAGQMVMDLVRKHGIRLLPVDSEHSAIFQCMQACRPQEVRRLILTASGGPFRDWPRNQLENVTYNAALSHPTWNMGPKITVDSATMMNKALELIEAHWLFDVPQQRIDVLVHPQSIAHSAIELIDSGLLVQMGAPDMRLPIQYALTYPERRPARLPRCQLDEVGSLDFYALDNERFPAVKLARQAVDMGGTAPAVLNAANEAAVELFRHEKIKFTNIWELTANVLQTHRPRPADNLETIMAADLDARNKIHDFSGQVQEKE